MKNTLNLSLAMFGSSGHGSPRSIDLSLASFASPLAPGVLVELRTVAADWEEDTSYKGATKKWRNVRNKMDAPRYQEHRPGTRAKKPGRPEQGLFQWGEAQAEEAPAEPASMVEIEKEGESPGGGMVETEVAVPARVENVAESAQTVDDVEKIVRDHFLSGSPGDDLMDLLDDLQPELRDDFATVAGLSEGMTDRVSDLNRLYDKYGPKGVAHDELERTGGGSKEGGIPAGEPVGTDVAPAPAPVLPAAGEGTEGGGELPTVPPDHDISGTADGGEPGEAGDITGDVERAGDGIPASETAGGPGEDVSLRDGGGIGGRDSSGNQKTAREQSLEEPPVPENPTDLSAGNFHYEGVDFVPHGAKTKFWANIEAIKTLQSIELEGRTAATPAEQEIMAKFCGWGQFPALFNDYGDFQSESARNWDKERRPAQVHEHHRR